SASAEQTVSRFWYSNDCHFVAAFLFQLADRAGTFHWRLGLAIYRSCDRGKSACIFSESDLLPDRPVVVDSPRGRSDGASQTFHIQIDSKARPVPAADANQYRTDESNQRNPRPRSNHGLSDNY